jgi:hypothetical protein
MLRISVSDPEALPGPWDHTMRVTVTEGAAGRVLAEGTVRVGTQGDSLTRTFQLGMQITELLLKNGVRV